MATITEFEALEIWQFFSVLPNEIDKLAEPSLLVTLEIR